MPEIKKHELDVYFSDVKATLESLMFVCLSIILSSKLILNQQNVLREAFRKKNNGYNEFGTKGGGLSELSHYLKQI